MGIDELKDKQGTVLGSVECEIDKSLLSRFAQAVGDPNPKWQVMAPPTLIMTIGIERIQEWQSSAFPSATLLHGSSELESYQPVKLGDVIKATINVTNLRQRPGKLGNMVFITFDTNYTNQRQELVARTRQLVMSY